MAELGELTSLCCLRNACCHLPTVNETAEFSPAKLCLGLSEKTFYPECNTTNHFMYYLLSDFVKKETILK